jgi:hypothetical protein
MLPFDRCSSARNLETNERIAIKKISGVFDSPVDAKRTLRCFCGGGVWKARQAAAAAAAAAACAKG